MVLFVLGLLLAILYDHIHMIIYVGLFGHSAVVFHVFMLFHVFVFYCLQCFDAVGWAAGRASGL